MPVLPKKPLGKTGLSVSNLGFGCMRLPIRGGNAEDIDADLAIRMIRRAIDAGVNYVDTAYPYHGNSFPQPGRSEPLVARALKDGYRDKVILATKLPMWTIQKRTDMDRLLDDQLKRLETGRIDIYLAHNVNSANWAKMRDLGLLSFLDSAKKDGRIGHIGFSFHDDFALFKQVIEAHHWEVAQIQYNYLDVNYQAGKAGLDLAASRGIGMVVMEPLRGGFLINHVPEDLRIGLKALRPEWSMADWGLRWLWNQPEVGVVLSGMSNMAQVEENLRIAAGAGAPAMAKAELDALDGVRRRFNERLEVNCTACDYCQPCPQGVAISRIFSMYNEYSMADDPALRARAKTFYNNTIAQEQKADRCVGCADCETRCPQHIPIATLMPKAVERLGAVRK